jgi:hypothetical protein
VVVYAEHISISPLGVGAKWTVKQVLFKGFFEELIIEREEVSLRVINYARRKHPVGSKIGISIKKFYEFGKWLS